MARQFFDPNVPANAQPGMSAQMRVGPLAPADMAQRLNMSAPAPQANLNDLWMSMEMQKHVQAMSVQQMRGNESAWATEFGSSMSNIGGSSSQAEVGHTQSCM